MRISGMVVSLSQARILAIIVVAALVLMGTAVGEVSREGLVGEWHFDGDAKDSSGNGNDGTINGGAAFVDGKFWKAMSFDGVDDYIERSYDPDFTPGTNSWTVAAWVKAKNMESGTILDWYRGGANGVYYGQDDYSVYRLVIIQNRAAWDLRDDYNNEIQLRSSSSITDYTWHFISGTFNPSLDNINLYVDGQLVNSSFITLTSLSDGGVSIPLEIGRIYRTGLYSPYNYFNGLIDEVRIYNRALSAEEVKASYEAGQIVITSSVSGAEVLLDGISKGSTTPTLALYGISPGAHAVKCRLSGYLDYETMVNLPASSTVSATCSLVQPGSISVTSSPSGAEIYLDGILKGTATLILDDVSPGNHFIWCKKSGFEDFQQNIEVKSGGVETFTCNLDLTAPTPILTMPAPTTPKPTPASNPLTVMVSSELPSVEPGQASTITVIVTGKDGEEISGASLWLETIPVGGINPSFGTTNMFGKFTSNFTASSEGKVTVKARVKKDNFEGKGEVQIMVSKMNPNLTVTTGPTDNGNNDKGSFSSWVSIIILAIVGISTSLMYIFYVKKREKSGKEIEKLCMHCRVPIPLDSKFCEKCGKKQ